MLTGQLRSLRAPSPNPRPLGLMRASFGILVLLRGVYLIEQLQTVAGRRLGDGHELLGLLLIGLVITPWMALGGALVLGWLPRVTSGVLAALIFGLLAVDPEFYNNHLYLIGLVALLLACANPTGLLSIDARHGRSAPATPRWPGFLLKAQVSTVYTFAALSKLQEDFVSGLVLHVNLSRGPFSGFLPKILLESFPVLVAISVTVIVAQFFLAWALWINPLRGWAFLVGLALHAPMLLLANSWHQALRLAIFSALMWVLYLGFLHTPVRSRSVSWNARAPTVDTIMRWLEKCDWFRGIIFNPDGDRLGHDQAPRSDENGGTAAIRLRDAQGRVYDDIDALRQILAVSPIGYLWAALLDIPVARRVGNRLLKRSWPVPADAVHGTG